MDIAQFDYLFLVGKRVVFAHIHIVYAQGDADFFR